MKNKIKIAASTAIAALALAIPGSVLAATNIVPPEIGSNNITIENVIVQAIRIIMLVAFVLSFVFLLIGGIRWITSGGDEKAVASARNTITAALIGLVVVLLAFALIKLVENFFGISIFTNGINICVPSAVNTNPC